MIVEMSSQLGKLRDIKNGTIKEGLKLDIPEIDEYLRYKPTNFNVVLGHANVGKTSMVLFLMLCYTIKHKVKWLVYSSENEAYSLIRKLIEYTCQTPLTKIKDADIEIYAKFIDRHFKFVEIKEAYDFEQLLDLFADIKKTYDFDGVMVDPYNSLVKNKDVMKQVGGNGHDYDYHVTTQFRLFCKNQNVTMWLCTHANTEANRRVHKMGHEFEGHPMPVNANDVEGGGKFVNRADDFMVIHRYLYHPTQYMYGKLFMKKVKEIETGGRPNALDAPIDFKAMVNNVGYEINGKSIIAKIYEDIQVWT